MENKRIARIAREKFLNKPLFQGITDIRKNPSIKLRTILMSLFLMPFLGLTSLLSLDREARTKAFKSLFDCKRKMVASDSTLARVLGWLSLEQLRVFLLSFLIEFESQNLLRKQLSSNGSLRRLGILDGSYMGGHWLVTLCLPGKINYPAVIRRYHNQGQELNAARGIINLAPTLLGPMCPELWLLDALYFNKNTFKLVRSQNAHLLIKVKEAEYREVTKDAQNLFDHFGGDLERKGFDKERLCNWHIKQTTDTFAGYPVQVIQLTEFYPKRKKDRLVRCWIVTTDFSLSLAEIREAAHQRWQIENNTFKRISHLSGTKRFYFKDHRPFFNLLHIFFAAMAVLHAIIYILSRYPRLFKALRGGVKSTWRNIFSQIKEVLLQIKCPFKITA